MNRIYFIVNFLLGKNLVIFDSWSKEVLCVLGKDEEVCQYKVSYDFAKESDNCFVENNGKVEYRNEYKENS